MPKIPPIPFWMKALLALFFAAFFVTHSLANNASLLELLRKNVAHMGFWGVALFTLVYIAASFATLPGILLTVAAGAIYGPLLGTAIASAASTLAALGTFLAARHFPRDSVEQRLHQHRRFRFFLKASDQIEKHAFAMVIASRMVPLFPFFLTNYAFGRTRIAFKSYLFWSWLCMLPGIALFVTVGDLVAQAAAGSAMPWLLTTFSLALILALGLSALFVRRHFNFIEKTEETEKGIAPVIENDDETPPQ